MSGYGLENILTKPIPQLLQESVEQSSGKRTFTFVSGEGEADTIVSFTELASDVRRFAAAYRQLGVKKGERIALMLPDSRSFVTAFLSGLHLGAVPVPLYPPMRVDSLGDYLDQTRHIVASAGVRLIVTSNQVRRVVGSLGKGGRHIVTDTKLWEEKGELAWVPSAMDELAFLQYTSGSTSHPKGVTLSYKNLASNMFCMANGVQMNPEQDIVVSWLPLYHDMGLIGCVLTCIATQTPLVLIPPLDFLKRPVSWLRSVSKYRGSLGFAPNFAYGLTARRVRARDLKDLDLSSWRVAGCGAEPIQRRTLEAFGDRFQSVGFDVNAFLPAYGLAESTLAVTFAPLSTGLKSIHVSRETLISEERAELVSADAQDAEEMICLGLPFKGHGLGILGPDGFVEDGRVGEVVVQGPSVTSGYFEADEHNQSLFWEGWLRTGDLGFLHEGQLVICGRQKDLIIHNGRNYYASDIEAVACSIEGVRPGQVAAFGVYNKDHEDIVVCAEIRAKANPEEIQRAIQMAVMERFGLKVTKVPIVPRGALPKTSSGKIRRHKARELFLNEQFDNAQDSKLDTARHLASSQIGLLRNHITGFLNRLNRDRWTNK